MEEERRVELILQFETGTISEDNLILLFEDLIDSGMINNLQGHYGRTAERLIDVGLIGKDNTNLYIVTKDIICDGRMLDYVIASVNTTREKADEYIENSTDDESENIFHITRFQIGE